MKVTRNFTLLDAAIEQDDSGILVCEAEGLCRKVCVCKYLWLDYVRAGSSVATIWNVGSPRKSAVGLRLSRVKGNMQA